MIEKFWPAILGYAMGSLYSGGTHMWEATNGFEWFKGAIVMVLVGVLPINMLLRRLERLIAGQ